MTVFKRIVRAVAIPGAMLIAAFVFMFDFLPAAESILVAVIVVIGGFLIRSDYLFKIFNVCRHPIKAISDMLKTFEK